MPKYFVDTNIFLRTLAREEQKSFTDCKRFLTNIKNNQVDGITSTVVLMEVAWTLASHYKFSKKEVLKAIKSILTLSGLKILDKYDLDIALKLYEEKSVKLIDTVVASIKGIREKKITVVSYDGDFDKLGVLRKEPGEITSNHQ